MQAAVSERSECLSQEATVDWGGEVNIWKTCVSSRGKSKYRDSEKGLHLMYLRNGGWVNRAGEKS